MGMIHPAARRALPTSSVSAHRSHNPTATRQLGFEGCHGLYKSLRRGLDFNTFGPCLRFRVTLFVSISFILAGASILLSGGPKLATNQQTATNVSTRISLPPSPDELRTSYCTVLEVDPNGNVAVVRPSLEPLVHAKVLDFFKERVKDAVLEYGPFGHSSYFDLDTSDTPTCIGRLPENGETCRDMNTKVGCCSSGRPLVGVARNICCNCSLPLPIHANQIQESLANMMGERDPYDWKDKKPLAVWHGSETGLREYAQFYVRNFNLSEVNSTPRQKIVQISQQHPNLLHASMEMFPWKDLLKYKFIVTVSGYAYAGMLKPALLSNSCVLRQDEIATEWYEPWLEQWAHFVPVKYDLSDLIEKIQWAVNQDKECQRIAEQGKIFAEKHFKYSSVNKFVHKAISGQVPLG